MLFHNLINATKVYMSNMQQKGTTLGLQKSGLSLLFCHRIDRSIFFHKQHKLKATHWHSPWILGQLTEEDTVNHCLSKMAPYITLHECLWPNSLFLGDCLILKGLQLPWSLDSLLLEFFCGSTQLDLSTMFQGGECYDLTSKKPAKIKQE